ncbi:MAG: acetylglutamate kinase [Alistipes sp.]|nr:acetylglutamate kinase [Candidatus Minthomonas equi]
MIKVVKIGGNVVDNEELLQKFCKDFASLEGDKVLVHGGGVMASRIQEALGQNPLMVEGRRVTDEETLKTVSMVYGGWCSKHIVASLQKFGCNAIGLSGCDANILTTSRRAPKMLSDGVTRVDYGFVGDVTKDSVNVPALKTFIDLGIVPVLNAINHDGAGSLLNTNADTIASSLAAALGGELLYLFEKKGVLYDVKDDGSVISSMDIDLYGSLRAEGRIDKGMIPKLDNAFGALRNGAAGVVVKHSFDLLEDNAGTRLVF